MPYIATLIFLTQVACAVHVVRTGKNMYWLWLIFFAPAIGCLVYVIAEVLPAIGRSRATATAKKTLIRRIDPKRALRAKTELLNMSDTIENRLAFADECIEGGMYSEAIETLEKSLTGLNENDPAVMSRLAHAYFENSEPEKTTKTLDALIAAHPSFKSATSHLLYARALEAQGEQARAIEEYEVLRDSFPGEEARIRYAQMLQQMGDHDKAAGLFEESLLRAKHAPKHYQKAQRHWLKIASKG